jgi:hypothetical protein
MSGHLIVIASEAKQSSLSELKMDCFVAPLLAMTQPPLAFARASRSRQRV